MGPLFSRRLFVSASASAAALGPIPFTKSFAGEMSMTEIKALAKDAVIWGSPLVFMGRMLDMAIKAGRSTNKIYLNFNVASPEMGLPAPNVDVLYGIACVDLADGPQVIAVPATHDRYFSIQMNDVYQNTFGYIGKRTTGTSAGAFAITPPSWKGKLPDGVAQISATTTQFIAFFRTHIQSREDLAAARGVHASYQMGSLADWPTGLRDGEAKDKAIICPTPDFSKEGAAFFEKLAVLAKKFPPLPGDMPHLARFAPLGLGSRTVRPSSLDPILAEAVIEAHALIAERFQNDTIETNGWRTRYVPAFFQDPPTRAGAGYLGPGTNVAEEALYFYAFTGADGQRLNARNKNYRIHFHADKAPPVFAFWSLTLQDRNYFLFPNPLERYMLSSSAGLRTRSDGSLDLAIQADPPADPDVNWLPAPRDEFSVALRMYLPRPEVLDRSYQLPPIQIVP